MRVAEAADALAAQLSESERIRVRVSGTISEVYPALLSAVAAVDGVLQAHNAEYVPVRGRAKSAAKRSGQREPVQGFVLPNTDIHDWRSFRDQLDKLVWAAPDAIQDGGAA